MSHGPERLYSSEEERQRALDLDRQVESMPLPGAEQRHYTSEAQRQAALAAAERANIAKAAGKAGLTSDEWRTKRDRDARSGEGRY
ncbi:MAG TPA: hypothetical protein VFP32_01340 [Candidatus Saccharimonadales bacterium]|nr:hypothetical protein [Candidatus Saccharimonadales bacterium]